MPPTDGWALEASTSYSKFLSFDGVPERMSETLNSVKFIYVMRNPVDRMPSHLHHNVFDGLLPYKCEYKLEDLGHYLNVSKYYLQLNRYQKSFPEKNIILISLEDLISDHILSARSICRYLGVDCHFDFKTISTKSVTNRENSVNLSKETYEEAR